MNEPSISQKEGKRFVISKSILFRTSYRAEFPEEGVINSHGYLFHHFLPFILTDEHIIRLEQFAIKLKKYTPFSREEDEKIRENWKEFAEECDFAYEDARLYVGFLGNIHVGDIDEIAKTRKENDLLVELAMWPRLCRKLENRSAQQIQCRICEIFDPYYVGRSDPIPLETAIDAFMRFKEGECMADLAMEYGYPFSKLRAAINTARKEAYYQGLTMEDVCANPKILDTLKMPRREYTRFFADILKQAHINEEFIRDAITNHRHGWKKVIKEEMEGFNWTKLLRKYRRQNERSLRREWFNVLSEICKMYYNELDANFLGNEDNASDSGKDEAWGIALRQILPRSLKTLPVLKLYCHALYRSVAENSVTLYLVDISTRKLIQKLMKYQIINQPDYDIKTCECFKTIALYLRNWNRDLFRFISFPFRTKDKLKIAEKCYERLIETHGEYPETENLPSITRTILVESTILVLRNITKGEWIPPKFLRQWIRNSSFIPFFSSSPGSQVYCEEDELRRARKTIFPDNKSLRVDDISQYGRAAIKAWRSEKPRQPVEESEDEEPSRGWHAAIRKPRKLSRKRHFTFPSITPIPSTTPARMPQLFETIMESPSRASEHPEEPLETPQNEQEEPVLAGFQISQPVISTPIKNIRKKNNNEELLSPVVKKKKAPEPVEEQYLSGFDSPEEEQNEDEFSHLRIADIRPVSKKKTQNDEAVADLTWSNIFG